MENLLTGANISNPGLRILLPEVEIYFVGGVDLSMIAVYQPRKISINIV